MLQRTHACLLGEGEGIVEGDGGYAARSRGASGRAYTNAAPTEGGV